MDTVKPGQFVQVELYGEDPVGRTKGRKLEMIDADLAEFNDWLVTELNTHPMLAIERQMLKTYLCRKLDITR
jgi:hypothetical protein